MAGNPLSAFMLGLLGAGNALSAGVETYEKRKDREARTKQPQAEISQGEEKIGLEKSKLAYEENPENPENQLKTAQASEYNARAKLYGRTDPNRPRTSTSTKDYTTAQLRAAIDALTNRTKTLPLSPDEKSQYDAMISEFNRRTGVKPQPAAAPAMAAPQSSGGIGDLLKFLVGGSTASATPPPDKKAWQQYDQ